MSGVENTLDLFQPDAGIFYVTTNSVGVGFKSFDGEFRPGRSKRKVIFEEVVVTIDMGHRQNL